MLKFAQDIQPIEGWLTKKEASFLYSSAKRVKKETVIVEIGSWKGRSTVCLAKGSREGNRVLVYAIDPHTGSSETHRIIGKLDTYKEFLNNMVSAHVRKLIKPFKTTSLRAAKKLNIPVGFIFIDGDHGYRSSMNDYLKWNPKVVDGGVFAFHDSWYFLFGVNFATSLILLTSQTIRNPRLVDSITTFEKVDHNNILNRLENIIFVLYRWLFGIKGFLELKYHGSTAKR